MPRTGAPAGTRWKRVDFHSHSYLTDGTTSPTDMWHEAELRDHRVLALTDHIGLEDPTSLLKRLRQEASAWDGEAFVPLVGVEITQVPPRRIADAARAARAAGAEIVLVHGESVVERVAPGTNHAAIASAEVDILAHPGLIDLEDVELARAHGVVLEISGRHGHGLGNGHVVRLALEAQADLVVDSDAHRPQELLPPEVARSVARGAGVPEERLEKILVTTPEAVLRRLRRG
jgi:putative hydrolase